MGFMGYKFLKVLPITFLGNLVFNSLYASGAIEVFEGLMMGV